MIDGETLARTCATAALDKKAVDPVVIDLRKISTFTEFFMICSGDSEPQIKAIANSIREALAEFVPEAFGRAHLAATGTLLGVRESRRIIGDYELSIEDYKACRSFDDEVLRNCYFIDIHTTQEECNLDPRQAQHKHEERWLRMEKGESHGIPYRCLTPRGLTNVLIAGRSISTDHLVQSSTRVMPVCLAMGEAAGIAAAMAANTSADVRAVNTDELRTRLKTYGAYLPDSDNTQPSVPDDA